MVAAAKANERVPQKAARGGEVGWHGEGAPNLNDPLLDVAAKKLGSGKVSAVVETEEVVAQLRAGASIEQAARETFGRSTETVEDVVDDGGR